MYLPSNDPKMIDMPNPLLSVALKHSTEIQEYYFIIDNNIKLIFKKMYFLLILFRYYCLHNYSLHCKSKFFHYRIKYIRMHELDKCTTFKVRAKYLLMWLIHNKIARQSDFIMQTLNTRNFIIIKYMLM